MEPEANFYEEFKRLHPKPYFSFPDIPDYKGYSFEKLNIENFKQLYLLFEDDDSNFVDERFKVYKEAKDYATYVTVCGAHSPKHGCQDWFFKLPGEEYVGIIHLYDLSLETFAQNNRRAWIGFATKNKFRNNGITTEVIQYFISYIFASYPAINFIHTMTFKENVFAKKLLTKVGFSKDIEERASKIHEFYLLSRPELS